MTLLPNRSFEEHPYVICPAGDCEIPPHWSLSTDYSCNTEEIWDEVRMKCVCTYRKFESFKSSWTETENEYASLQAFKNAVATDNGTSYRSSFAVCNFVPSEEPKSATWKFYFNSPHHRKFWIDWPWSFDYWDDWPKDDPDIPGPVRALLSTRIIGVNGLIESSIFPPLTELKSWGGVSMSRQRCQVDFSGSHTSKSAIKIVPDKMKKRRRR